LTDAEAAIFALLNRERVGGDVAAVLRSPGLDQVAFGLAVASYASGTVTILGEDELRTVLNNDGILSTVHTELAVLTASPEAGHAALVKESAPNMVGPRYSKAGITVIRGPLGLLIVEILSG
jgi:hypothetical protein